MCHSPHHAPCHYHPPPPRPHAALQSGPRPVVPTFFSDRIPAITQQQSRWIVEGMTYIGMLDADGWLLGDPERNRNVRKVRWR